MDVLYQEYGRYFKGFFAICIDKELKDNIKSTDFTSEEMATFIHEYIHFLQNVSTTYGVSYFNFISKTIQLFVSESYRQGEIIQLPITKSDVENAEEEYELQAFYVGCDKHIKIHHINEIKFEREEIIEAIINIDKMDVVNIYYDDKDIPYTFGAACIEESMAYLIESEKFNAEKRKNELPYNACELICEKLCPTVANSKNIIVALAELSLMHYNSGVMFCKMLQIINGEKIKYQTTGDVHRYFKDKIVHLYENMSEQFKETKATVNFLYPVEPELPFKECNEFLRKALYNGFRCRCGNELFISQVMDLDEMEKYSCISKWFNLFGMPPIIDKNNDVYSSEKNIIRILVPIAVYNQFNSKERKCYMYDICKKQNLEQFNENNCENEPWKQAKNEKLCPYAAFWYHYSLEGCEILK